ncbi:MAG: Gfo/Idh/MocA family oxidoreductase [Verrucomicrobiota bacterium]
MKRKIRWGVIGSGGIAARRTIPEGILPAKNAELVAVYSRNKKNNAVVAKQFGAQAANSLAELFSSEIDAVYIASPNHAHLEQTRLAAAAGKHVFCEKPLGMSVDEARRMIAVCARAKVNLGTAFMMRYHSQHQAALRVVKEGMIGQPVFARAQLSCWYPPSRGAWRQISKLGGGGALIDLAGHCLDLLEMFFGPITALSCMINRTVHRYEAEDSAVVMTRFKNGALATVDTLFCIPDDSSKNRLELYGSRGSILAQGTIGQESSGEMTAYLEKDEKSWDALQLRSKDGGRKIPPKRVNIYQAEIEAFSQALLEGRDTADSAQAGLRSQFLLAACYKSARMGQLVKII